MTKKKNRKKLQKSLQKQQEQLPQAPKLTIKERKFLDEYFRSGNGTLSAMKVYDCKNYSIAATIASQLLKKLKSPIKTYLEVRGLSLNVLSRVLVEGLQATRTTNAAILLTKDGETVKAQEQGVIETPDYHARHKYLLTASRWLGADSSPEEQEDGKVKKRIVAEEFFS